MPISGGGGETPSETIFFDSYANIYILGVCAEKPYIKPLERNIVYIPITTSSNATSMPSKLTMARCELIVRR